MKSIKIILKPSYNKTISELGFDENEDYNEDAVLFQQGYDMEILEVNPGDIFEIDEDFESGHLENYENEYKLIFKNQSEFEDDEYNENWEYENEETESIIFYQGNYLLREDGITFEQL